MRTAKAILEPNLTDQLSLGLDCLFPETDKWVASKSKRTGAFTDNMSLPVHRWFRYSAGFSAEWVQRVISDHELRESDVVFDPFAGSGTTLLAAQLAGVTGYGAEAHHFVRRIANAKLGWSRYNTSEVLSKSLALLDAANKKSKATLSVPTADLLAKCYTNETLLRLCALKEVYEERYSQGDAGELIWLAITSILRDCSKVGTASWQYVLPNKKKMRVQDPFVAFRERVQLFCSDIKQVRNRATKAQAAIVLSDARTLSEFESLAGRVNLVITSPPYPNNYDYADATRLEMTFWGEVSGWGDLQGSVRKHLVRSCSQHSAAERLVLEELLSERVIAPIHTELTQACSALAEIRETKGGKKTYHTMVAAYFVDLAKSWRALRRLCGAEAKACFVIGDSAPYGVHIPVERWLGELAVSAGFRSWSFEKVRDRNTKWKNRKHRVPLKEGNLWVTS